jgi:hypothetical protein
LTPAELIAVWECGNAVADWHKALAILARGAADQDHLRALSMGERNARLLALRRDTFGGQLRAYVKCPRCGEPLEFEQGIDELLDGYDAPAKRHFVIEADDHRLDCRVLDSTDLAATAPLFFAEAVREALIARALVAAVCAGQAVVAAALSPALHDRIEAELARHDPLARLAIPLGCAACEHVWRAPLDIVAFFWSEIERQARTTLAEVIALARGFGWAEHEILAMTPARRRFYLESLG